MTYVVVSSGHLRGLHGLGADSAPETVESVLAKSQTVLDELNNQRTRLSLENGVLKAPIRTPTILALLNKFGIIEIDARVDSTDNLIAATDRFVLDVYNRVEAVAKDKSKPEATRLAAAQRLLRATINILQTVGGTSPIDDFAKDIGEAVNGVIADAGKVLNPSDWKIPPWVYGLGILAGLYYTSQIIGSLGALKGPSKQG